MMIVPVEQRSAAENVRLQLVGLIERGHFAVDERLPSEAELAQSFGVSRSVVREALQSLQALGLTRSHAGKGTFVTERPPAARLLSGRYLPTQLNEVRETLEIPAAALAAERHTDADAATLRDLVDRFEVADDVAERVEIDSQFHVAIGAATGNPLFAQLIGELRAEMQEQAMALSNESGRPRKVRAEHRTVFDAIIARDADGATAAMRAHLGAVARASRRLNATKG